MHISWNIPLVVLSVLVAMIGSFAALTHAQRMRANAGLCSWIWLCTGGLTLGVAIWTMHFIGMLAFHLPIQISYDIPLTLLSIVPAIAAALLGFYLLCAPEPRMGQIVGGSVLMGVGISTMHYTGMAALKMSPSVNYSSSIVALSVLIAIMAALGALLIVYASERKGWNYWLRYGAGSVIMGLAISGMHYSAMAAAEFPAGSICLSGASRIEPEQLAMMVSMGALFLFSGGVMASIFDQRMVWQRSQALEQLEAVHAESEQRAQRMAETMTQELRASETRARLIQMETAALLRRNQILMKTAIDGIHILDVQGNVVEANDSFCRLLGYTPEEVTSLNVADWDRRWPAGVVQERTKQFIQDRASITFETVHRRKDGTLVDIELSCTGVEIDGQPYLFASSRDISERRRIQKETEKLLGRYQTLMKTALDGFRIMDIQGNVVEANDAFCHMLGYTQEEAIQLNIADWDAQWSKEELQERLRALVGKSARFETVQRRKDGTLIDVEISSTGVEIDGQAYFFASSRDISGRKLAEQKIHQLAYYDVLTRLPNRRLLMDRLQQALAVSARNRQHGAVLFLDLDNFKTLNDTKGHDIGDLLLIEVAKRLSSCVRDGDTVARLGGDEFVVVLETLSISADEAATQAEMVAEKIRAALNLPYQLEEYTQRSTPSIGIVLFHGHQENLDDLLRHADTAMYQAKTAGRNVIRFYDSAMQAAVEARAEMADELHLAIDKQQFILHCQIQVDSMRCPLGAEMLLRWMHPGRGLIMPAQFIPLAEEIGLIVPIGLWVLRTACAQLKAWQNDPVTRDLTLAVNVSAKQFRQADFVAQVKHVLLESGAKPSLLKLELTESTVLENVDDTIAKMRELKLLGVSFSMDDFGTGYSSLQYLKRLPLDQIKIDRSFVRDITTDPNDAAIVQAIIAMTEVLGLNVIAEGVETEAQREFLGKHGCRAFQGYLFGKPLPLEQFEGMLRGGQ